MQANKQTNNDVANAGQKVSAAEYQLLLTAKEGVKDLYMICDNKTGLQKELDDLLYNYTIRSLMSDTDNFRDNGELADEIFFIKQLCEFFNKIGEIVD